MNRAQPFGAFLRPDPLAPTLNNVYLVSVDTFGQTPFFADFLAGRLLVDILRQQQHRADTWTYVIMPEQLHWLFELKASMSRYKLVEKVLSFSSRVLNEYLFRRGPFWQGEYSVKRIVSVHEALSAARHLVALPRNSRLVESVADYPLWDARHWY